MLTNEFMEKLTQEQPFDPAVMGGSIKRKIVNPLLVAERAKCDFDREEALRAVYNAEQRAEFELVGALLKKHPQLASNINYYEMTREEKMRVWWDRFRTIMGDQEFRHLLTNNSHKKSKYVNWYYMFAGSNPMTLHMQMFTKSVLTLGSEE